LTPICRVEGPSTMQRSCRNDVVRFVLLRSRPFWISSDERESRFQESGMSAKP
ncbi:hypothetical protein J6590_041519, partial [Homalodisca vitripennis]